MNLITHFLVVLSLVSLSMSSPYRGRDERDRYDRDRYDRERYDRGRSRATTPIADHMDALPCYIQDKEYNHCDIMPDGCMCVHGMADCNWSPVSEELALFCPDLDVGMTKTPPSTHAPYGYYNYDYDYDYDYTEYSDSEYPSDEEETKPPTHPPTKPPTQPPTTPKPPTQPPTTPKPPTHSPTRPKPRTKPPTRPTRPPTSTSNISWDGLTVVLKKLLGLTLL